jgi:hypothetical protein
MSVVADKYRGTPVYHTVYCELLMAARYRGTVTYQEIAQVMGLPLRGSLMGKEVGHILGEIAEDEHDRGRPMLSAVAVGVAGKPGSGLFALAREMGKLSGDSPEAEASFWEAETAACYQTWRRVLREAKA